MSAQTARCDVAVLLPPEPGGLVVHAVATSSLRRYLVWPVIGFALLMTLAAALVPTPANAHVPRRPDAPRTEVPVVPVETVAPNGEARRSERGEASAQAKPVWPAPGAVELRPTVSAAPDRAASATSARGRRAGALPVWVGRAADGGRRTGVLVDEDQRDLGPLRVSVLDQASAAKTNSETQRIFLRGPAGSPAMR